MLNCGSGKKKGVPPLVRGTPTGRFIRLSKGKISRDKTHEGKFLPSWKRKNGRGRKKRGRGEKKEMQG